MTELKKSDVIAPIGIIENDFIIITLTFSCGWSK